MENIEKCAYGGNSTGYFQVTSTLDRQSPHYSRSQGVHALGNPYVFGCLGDPTNQQFMNANVGGTPIGFPPINLSQQIIRSQSSQNNVSQNSISSLEVNSPSKDGKHTNEGKKRKSTGNKEALTGGKKGTSNKKWKPPHIEALISCLVELANNGYKVYKTFKAPAFKKAVEHVNSIFGENYTTYNVENHLRTLKDKWKLICEAKKLSGAGWDEESKMITLDTMTYAELIERHPKYKPYLNCPIPRYEELRIICGEDHATGEFRETSYDPDIDKEIPTINIDEDDLVDSPGMDGVRVSQFNGMEPSSIFIKPGTVSGKSSRPVKKKKREDSHIIIGEKLVEEMGKVATAIVGLKERTWVEVLADKVFGFQDISIDNLELVFNEYYKNEVEAKAFMVLPEPIQRRRILNVLERIVCPYQQSDDLGVLVIFNVQCLPRVSRVYSFIIHGEAIVLFAYVLDMTNYIGTK
ncbi:uncharacterized protein LOC109821858 [Asparagus officinalis]|uniref:uncharacterized protein LOC109821858 n=1 Tax=Asparagus officinalis TaxID=4686 RepID=UPI00098DED74|nr:uncharacterized protein LOC109821858 [Asparagus officinalis]